MRLERRGAMTPEVPDTYSNSMGRGCAPCGKAGHVASPGWSNPLITVVPHRAIYGTIRPRARPINSTCRLCSGNRHLDGNFVWSPFPRKSLRNFAILRLFPSVAGRGELGARLVFGRLPLRASVIWGGGGCQWVMEFREGHVTRDK